MTIPVHNESLKSILADMAGIGDILWKKGWAERNAGNISVDITHDLVNPEDVFDEAGMLPLSRVYEHIGGHSFLVTGSGKRMRDLGKDPEGNVLLIRINDAGDGLTTQSLSAHHTRFQPTSELPTHLALHDQLAAEGKGMKVVLHTHATELISLTQIRRFCREDELNNILWGMHPETKVFLPEGVGLVSYLLPGTAAIAAATLEKFKKYRAVVWEKHGCFAVGKDLNEAFDLIDTIAKSAAIYLQCRGAGFDPEGLTTEQLAELQVLSEKFS